ncbi:MAG: hypothetical protein V1850_07685 [Candidatus Bathyarchaeota archaeon]
MIGRIRVIPLAAESLGVRSMSTYITTPDVKVLIDPGVSLGPRFGLLPYPIEYRLLKECRKNIACAAAESDIVVINHYHFDHSTPTFTDYVWNFLDMEVAHQIYGGKIMLAKDFKSNVNAIQRRRGWMLKNAIKDCVKEFITANNRTFIFGSTLKFFTTCSPWRRGYNPWLVSHTYCGE